MESLHGSRATDIDEDEVNGDTELNLRMPADGTTTPEFTRRRFRDQDVEPEQTERRLIREWAQFSRATRPQSINWRDEFDEDRVGAENFEALNLDQRRAGTRRTAVDAEQEELGFVEFAAVGETLQD
jgi:hypothetical protein